MLFGPCPVSDAEGTILAHAVRTQRGIFRKGRILAGYANLPGPQEASAQAALLATRIP